MVKASGCSAIIPSPFTGEGKGGGDFHASLRHFQGVGVTNNVQDRSDKSGFTSRRSGRWDLFAEARQIFPTTPFLEGTQVFL